jgi:hypothetical protein
LCSLMPASYRFLTWFNLRNWRWRRHIPQKRRLTFNWLNGVISQNSCSWCCQSSRRTSTGPYGVTSQDAVPALGEPQIQNR